MALTPELEVLEAAKASLAAAIRLCDAAIALHRSAPAVGASSTQPATERRCEWVVDGQPCGLPGVLAGKTFVCELSHNTIVGGAA